MAALEELNLMHLPIETPEFSVDPMPFIARARQQHPWLARSSLGIVVTEYRAIDEMMRLDANLKMPGEDIVDFMGARGTGWGRFAEEQRDCADCVEVAPPRRRGSQSSGCKLATD